MACRNVRSVANPSFLPWRLAVVIGSVPAFRTTIQRPVGSDAERGPFGDNGLPVAAGFAPLTAAADPSGLTTGADGAAFGSTSGAGLTGGSSDGAGSGS